MNEMKESRSIQVSLVGRSFSVVTDEDANTIELAAQRVNSLIQHMNLKGHRSDEARAIAFVALKLAIELQKNEKQLASYTDETKKLTDLLNNALGASSTVTVWSKVPSEALSFMTLSSWKFATQILAPSKAISLGRLPTA